MKTEYDVIICGSGPSGCAAAIMLRDSGLDVALIDKDKFPRDKTCGDGLTLDSINQLKILSDDLLQSFIKCTQKTESHGIKVYTANRKKVIIPILQNPSELPMFTIKRYDFDNLLLTYIREHTETYIIEQCTALSCDIKQDKVTLNTDKGTLNSKIIIAADGAQSVLTKYCREEKLNDKDKAIALRQYFENVHFDNDKNYLEFYFHEKILPGGIWIFPVGKNKANVGLGMIISKMKKKNINLEKILQQEIQEGLLKDMFKDAKPVSKLQGHIIPIGKKNRIISGHRIILTGDAAGLANALSGEGIGNALRSGRIAAEHIIKNINGDFSALVNKQYDKEVYKRMGREFNNYRSLQRLCSYPFIINYIIGTLAPRFTHIFGVPDFINKIQSKRFFYFKVLKYMLFKKS